MMKISTIRKTPLRLVTVGFEDAFYRELDYVTKAGYGSKQPVRQNVATSFSSIKW